MRRLRFPVLCAAALAAVLVAAGCGGGDEATTEQATTARTATTPTLSKDEYIAQADAICAEVNAAVGTVDSTTTEVAEQVGQRADLYGGMVERLRSLGEPEDGAGLTAVLTAADDLANAEADAQLAAQRGDDSALSEAQASAEAALADLRSAADAYGLKDCGGAPSAPVAGGDGSAASGAAAPAGGSPSGAASTPAPTPAPTGGAAGGGAAAGGGGTGGAQAPSSGGVGPG